jgi:hypothetical protein
MKREGESRSDDGRDMDAPGGSQRSQDGVASRFGRCLSRRFMSSYGVGMGETTIAARTVEFQTRGSISIA